ncbi:hypothetical protein A7Q26_18230 [Sphingobium sp. TCM1]|nr:hypothetical protein A7Q26_18230 [Sphingobium sp. TCM1]
MRQRANGPAWLRHPDRRCRCNERAEAQAGGTILPTGGGLVGLSAAMAGKAPGAGVIIVADPLKLYHAMAPNLGATHIINVKAGDTAAQCSCPAV